MGRANQPPTPGFMSALPTPHTLMPSHPSIEIRCLLQTTLAHRSTARAKCSSFLTGLFAPVNFHFFFSLKKKFFLNLAGVAQWIECGPANQSWWFDSQSGHTPG